MSTHHKKLNDFSVKEGCRKKVTVMRTTTEFLNKEVFFNQMHFQTQNMSTNKIAIMRGTKQ